MSNRVKAILFMLISALAFTISDSIIKMLEHLSIALTMFFGYIVCVVISGIDCHKNNVRLFGKKQNQVYLFLRSITGIGAFLCSVYAVQHMKLADATVITKFFPFFVLIIALIYLKEKVRFIQILALVLALVGVVFVINPKFNSNIMPSMVALLAALLLAFAHIFVRKLSGRENPKTIVFHFATLGLICMIPFLVNDFVIPSGMDLIYLISCGVFALVGQYGSAYAYKLAKASDVSIYNYSSVVFAPIIGYLIWKEVLPFFSIIGIILVFAAGYINYKSINRKENI